MYTEAERTAYATEQFDDAVSLGFTKRVASLMMEAASPTLLGVCTEWVIASWWGMKEHLVKKSFDESGDRVIAVTTDLIRTSLVEACDRAIGCAGESHSRSDAVEFFESHGLTCPSLDRDEMVKILRGAMEGFKGMPLRSKGR